MAIALAGVAGAIDAIGYLTLSHLFTAHMTGNTVGMAAAIATGQWADALRRGWPVPAFVMGGILGAVVTELALRQGARRPLALALAAEAALLAAFWWVLAHGPTGPPLSPRYLLLATLAATAMGIQNAVFRQLGRPSVNTTVITGALSSLAEHAVGFAGRARERHDGARGEEGRLAALAGTLWVAYLLGAFLGGWTEVTMRQLCPALPLAVLGVVIAVDWRSPPG